MLLIPLFIIIPLYVLYFQRSIVPTYFEGNSSQNSVIFCASFEQLDLTLRKRALDLVWDKQNEKLSLLFSKRKTLLKANMVAQIIFSFIYSIIFLSFIVAENKDLGFYIAIIFCLFALVTCFRAADQNSKYLIQLEEMERNREDNFKKLFKFGSEYITNNAHLWLSDAIAKCGLKAKEIAHINPKQEFYIATPLQTAKETFSESKIAFIFFNQILCVVSEIYVDIKKTSYEFAINHSNIVYTSESNWVVEEFHLTDVVEIGYVPIASDNKSNGVLGADGLLQINLSNGSKKEYHTSRLDTHSLLAGIREEVRKAKLGFENASMSDYKATSIDSNIPNLIKRFCSKCGIKISEHDKFCSSCGVVL